MSKPDAVSADHFGFILNIRELTDGRVFVNDGKSRQLIIVDAALANRKVVIDSAAEGAQRYGSRATPIIPYLGDSTLFVDGASSTLLQFNPDGSFARVVAPPRPKDVGFLAYGASAVDAQGNLIYAVLPQPRIGQFEPNSRDLLAFPSDSSFVVRGNFNTRALDTIGRFRTPSGNRARIARVGTQLLTTFTYNPLTTRDEWAVFSSGEIGVVRGHDYHVDVRDGDGKWVAGPKLPFDFKRVTDDDKRALIDSAREAHAALAASSIPSYPPRDSTYNAPPGTYITAPRTASLKGTNGRVVEEYVPLDSMADYWPPIRTGAVKADLDAHLWILPTTSAQSLHGELVYDVVNNRGEMLYRVRMPVGRSVVGFGRNGVVYLMSKETGGWVLERARVNSTL